MSCSTPVAFLIFRRPDLTVQVFESIRQAKPKILLIVADGPRNDEEAILCQQAREVTENIDWECKVLRNYSDVNLGCRERVASGITWVFEQVEEAIILEDDCLPTHSFFSFCQTLLEYYRDDERIMVISGNNFQNGISRTKYSYYFSRYNHCWGWATWRRAWRYWNFGQDQWLEFKSENLMEQLFEDHNELAYWNAIFDMLFLENQPDTWDYVWTFACWSQGGLTVLPDQNLVSNIGFGQDATHTKQVNKLVSCLPTSNIEGIKHPPFIIRDRKADLFTFRNIFHNKDQHNLKKKILRIIKNRIQSTLQSKA